MAIGRTFEESLLKALRSTEYEPAADWSEVSDDRLEAEYLTRPTPDRAFAMFEAFERGYSVDEVTELTGIERWYVERYARVARSVEAAAEGDFAEAAVAGHTNATIAAAAGADVGDVEQEVPGRTYKQVDTCAGEFAAQTPYYYSSRKPEWFRGPFEGDAAAGELRVDRDVESVVVVGGGPIRIGQGVEFDYCSVHAIQALRDVGVDAHVVNNNPETVSTDYDTSDGLFFEPITAEEVADVVEATGADGVMVQFGGQTSVNIGHPLRSELDRRGLDAEILGTSVDAMDLAEDRDRFNRLMDDLGILQPEGGAATSEAEALELARGIGYPVLVRPSYVLGGRAMDVVHDDEALREYIEEAARVGQDKPVLVDEFLEDAVELDVDAVADGEDVLIGGIMEHVESAGVHSGDSACMIPPRSLSPDVARRVREVTEDIATALETIGLLNVQLAVRDGEVYVLEANPRSSRTVPFVSKATGVPIAKLAAKVMAGASLEELDVDEQVPEQVSIKEVVLPFDRLPGSDPRLGPEMKSTGEVMGTASTFGKAYGKAQSATGKSIPEEGTAVVDLSDAEFPEPDSEAGRALTAGFGEFFDVVEYDDTGALCDAIRAGEVDVIVSRNREALEVAVEETVTYFSTHASALATLEALEAREEPIDVVSVTERPRRQAKWGLPADDG
jgi:carbamoyl-phosphate synthase large subunit